MASYSKINSFERRFHPVITIISFCAPATIIRSLSYFLTSWLLFFYEVEFGLPIFIIAAIFTGTTVITIIIRPFLGYISDRNYTFTRK
jgi:Na+/melibiose symporter-like transporter